MSQVSSNSETTVEGPIPPKSRSSNFGESLRQHVQNFQHTQEERGEIKRQLIDRILPTETQKSHFFEQLNQDVSRTIELKCGEFCAQFFKEMEQRSASTGERSITLQSYQKLLPKSFPILLRACNEIRVSTGRSSTQDFFHGESYVSSPYLVPTQGSDLFIQSVSQCYINAVTQLWRDQAEKIAEEILNQACNGNGSIDSAAAFSTADQTRINPALFPSSTLTTALFGDRKISINLEHGSLGTTASILPIIANKLHDAGGLKVELALVSEVEFDCMTRVGETQNLTLKVSW